MKEALADMETAEDFFCYLSVPFDPDRLNVTRTLVLRRFREYLGQIDACHGDAPDEKKREWYAEALARAYEDFDKSVTPESRKYLYAQTGAKTCACHGSCSQIQSQPVEMGDFNK
ncbi:MAG: hypothetical protein HY751_07485 [Nitrospinae bacterium]|nr:hypothetical protein [Nitrospinota bacterium]